MTEAIPFMPDGHLNILVGGVYKYVGLEAERSELQVVFDAVVAGEFLETTESVTQGVPFGVDLAEEFGRVDENDVEYIPRAPEQKESTCKKVSSTAGSNKTWTDLESDGE